MTVTVSAAELAQRTQQKHLVRIDRKRAAMFLGFWLEAGIVEEVLPGRYSLTEKGQRVAAGLVGIEEGSA